jgi:hypothetical protein
MQCHLCQRFYLIGLPAHKDYLKWKQEQAA